MTRIAGAASVDIPSTPSRLFAIAADIENTPAWQPALREVTVVERDLAGRQTLVRISTRHGGGLLRFTQRAPRELSWVQEEGDAKQFAGAWRFEALRSGWTRATYEIELELGRRMGLLLRGPVGAVVRQRFIDAMPAALHTYVESSASTAAVA